MGFGPWMGKQTKKVVVPPREERLEKIGDPKPPKMGKLAPRKVEVPKVEDLLDKLKRVTSPAGLGEPEIESKLRQFWSFETNFIFEDKR